MGATIMATDVRINHEESAARKSAARQTFSCRATISWAVHGAIAVFVGLNEIVWRTAVSV
jgi:hypothetical protein